MEYSVIRIYTALHVPGANNMDHHLLIGAVMGTGSGQQPLYKLQQ